MASSEKKTVVPQSLIAEESVKKVLETDKGSDVLLKSWKVVDFTKPGDNYTCFVTSVEVKFSKGNGEDCEVTYIVKLNAQRKMEGFPDMTPFLFTKEGKFYEQLVPVLNEALTAAGQKPLRFPRCFLVLLEEGKEQIYFEDLRARGFKMFDRRKGMSKDHCALVLAELARLHGASYLLRKKFLEGRPAAEKYDFLAQDFFNFFPKAEDLFLPMLESNVDTGIMMLEKVGGYEKAIEWLKPFKLEIGNVFSTGMQSERYSTICHGDCWNNNILFKYDDEGRPVDLMLVDLQMCREVSLACDLNYFLYTSVTGDVRRPNIDHFMSIYHSTYKGVLEAGGLPMYFNQEELLEEFRGKNKTGLVFALGLIPALLMEPDEVPELSDRDLDELMQELRMITLSKLKTHPLCKPRYLSIFDEFMETGLIS
ncbi:uncharacterized protein LOC135225828 isoform X3 [Macrobrachium nipponense]|uniref:uncharacterized protein LOC135225828 isoform X1 n=1 Tax=Macrobrachium nipponense TaxID=159736 RepID=UPI0030C7B58B